MTNAPSGCSQTDPVNACHYCGLPLGGPPVPSAAPRYCCFGCRFAEAVAQEKGDTGQVRWTLTRLGVAIFLTMNVMVFTLALWSEEVYTDALQGGEADTYHNLLRFGSLLFTGPVLLLLGGPLLEDVLSDWRRRSAATDILLLVGVIASFIYSVASAVAGSGHIYFEVTCLVLVAVTLGRWLEAAGKLKTTEALRALESLLPERVRMLLPEAGESRPHRTGSSPCYREVSRALREVRSGDVLRVLAGERIPVDGVVVRHTASVDQQAVTGESEPVCKQPGDAVFSGTLNLDGELCIEAREPGGEGTLRRMIEAVAAAASHNERYQRLADRISAWFLPAVLVIALASFGLHGMWRGLPAGLLTALAVVLIACPCALGLATPMALWVALGRASRYQLLFRDGDSLTRLATIRAVCFDKTGTLTTGQPGVDELLVDASTSRDELLRIAAGIATRSNHALARSVAEFAAAEQAKVRNATDPLHKRCDPQGDELDQVRTYPGRGISSWSSLLGAEVYLGSERFLREQGQWEENADADELRARAVLNPTPPVRLTDRAAALTGSVAWLGWGGTVRAAFLFREQLRPDVREMLNWCRAHGLHVEVLTGDHAARGEQLQRELGVPVRSGLLPEDKQHVVEELRRSHGPVLMVGDGINDAPALATADVGAAMGCGTDISRHSADVCLLGNDLGRIPQMIALGQQTVGVIRWNLLWAFAYNTIGVLIAAAGLLNPMLAAAAMVVSSVMVVSNALRLGNEHSADAPRTAAFNDPDEQAERASVDPSWDAAESYDADVEVSGVR